MIGASGLSDDDESKNGVSGKHSRKEPLKLLMCTIRNTYFCFIFEKYFFRLMTIATVRYWFSPLVD
jgi:hypothetical protein